MDFSFNDEQVAVREPAAGLLGGLIDPGRVAAVEQTHHAFDGELWQELAAADAAVVATWQASERGQRIVHAAQHLHGGMGADTSFPMHRSFLWGKQIEPLLGGPSRQLAFPGTRIAGRARARASESAAGGPAAGRRTARRGTSS